MADNVKEGEMTDEETYQAYINWLIKRIRDDTIYEDNRIILHPLNNGEYLITRADYLPMGSNAIEAELKALQSKDYRVDAINPF